MISPPAVAGKSERKAAASAVAEKSERKAGGDQRSFQSRLRGSVQFPFALAGKGTSAHVDESDENDSADSAPM